ncbi:MAG: mechanosensitive ion channel domain-containing protein [Pseudomonadota bacterium]
MARAVGAFCALLLLLALWLGHVPAFAQAAPEAVDASTLDALSPAAVDAAVARLSDTQVRDLLLQELGRRAATAPTDGATPADVVTTVSERLSGARARLIALVASIGDLPHTLAAVWQAFAGSRPLLVVGGLAAAVAAAVAAGLAAEWAAARWLRPTAERLRTLGADREATVLPRMGAIVGRFGLDVLQIGAFTVASVVAFLALWQDNVPGRYLAITLIAAYTFTRLFAAFSRMLLEPDQERLRLFDLTDAEADKLHRGLVRTAAIAAFGLMACGLIALLGEGQVVHDLLVFLVGLGFVISLVLALAQAQPALRRDLLVFDRSSPARRFAAQVVPPATVAFVALLWPFFLLAYALHIDLSSAAALVTMGLVVFVPHLDAVVARMAAAHAEQTEDADAGLRMVGVRLLRVLLWIGAIGGLCMVYAVDLQELARAGVGERLSGALFDILLTVLLAYVFWEFARVLIDRRLRDEAGPGAAGEHGDEGGTGASRVATLLPLFRVTLQITIIVMAVLLILSALGVNIGPLLAGAGVVGLAVGFGAQTLVRDIVSGVFFLLDDAFRRGEYIDVGDVKGTVEKISVRSLRLRHHRGYLHTIPFGEIRHLTNYSRDWVIMKLEFRVPFDTDIELVRRLFKQIGKDLQGHPDIGKDFLEPFKSQGVFTLDDSALVVRGKFMAKPGKQFMARREIYNAVQAAFAENGIKFADRRVTVQVADAGSLTPEEQARVVQAGASVAQAAPPLPAAS